MGGYQWRFLWLGVVRSDSPLFAPAGETNILAHHGLVAWSQPHDDDADPPLGLGTLVRGEGTSLRVWGSSHIVSELVDARARRSEFDDPENDGFRYRLDVMALTMRVWPGNAYDTLGDSLRILVSTLQPSATAPAGFDQCDDALSFAHRPMLRWVRATLGPLLRAERHHRPRLLFHQLRAATDEVGDLAATQLDQHVCNAVRGPVEVGRSHEGIGSGIMLVGPHVKLGGAHVDSHVSLSDADEWPALPGPLRGSYSEAAGWWYPSLYVGSSRRMRESAQQKKRRTRR